MNVLLHLEKTPVYFSTLTIKNLEKYDDTHVSEAFLVKMNPKQLLLQHVAGLLIHDACPDTRCLMGRFGFKIPQLEFKQNHLSDAILVFVEK